MLTSANVDFISCESNSFKGNDGKDIEYQKITFLHETDDKPISLTALTELDLFDGDDPDIHLRRHRLADRLGFRSLHHP